MYVLIEMQKLNDTTVAIPPIINKTDWNEAESKFHSILAYAAGSELPVHSAVILRNDGLLLKNESYTHE